MKAELTWNGRMGFNAAMPSGAEMLFDTYKDVGGDEEGPSPVETLCSAAAACSGMDVVSILQKMRQPIESYRLEVSWERGEDGVFPRPVTKIKITHHLVGKDLVEAKVAKAVQLSDEKYCSVMATLRTPPELETVFNIGQ